MKVLFVGNYRDQTGWGYAATQHILALDAAGIRVACRPVSFGGPQAPLPPRIAALEQGEYGVYDTVIQHVLPHHLDYSGAFGRNVAMYYTETSTFGRTNWSSRINLLDMAWVSCQQSLRASSDSGVDVPIRVVHVPCDVSRYEQSYEPLPIRKELPDHFIFYTIGEFNKRKNWRALLTAFHLEFDVNEPVSLLIKTGPKGSDSEWDALQGVTTYCRGVKEGLKLYDSAEHYKQEIILTGRYSDREILRLHSSCDCGVFTSYGEAWCLPAFDSMAMGRTPVVPAWGGFLEYMGDAFGWLVPVHMEPAYGTHMDTFPDLHTAREEWAAVDIAALRAAMRSAYEDGDLRRKKSLQGTDRAYDFTHLKVGELMRSYLDY